MSTSVPSVEGFRRHVCSLQAISAQAGISVLYPERRTSRRHKEICHRNRARLSKSLLAWCDEFYDSTDECIGLTSHLTSDSVWDGSSTELARLSLDHRDPCDPENIRVFVGVVDHIDWEWFERTGPEPIADWIAHYFPKYAYAVFYEHSECRRTFFDLLTRLYKHPHISDALSLVVTKTLLMFGVPADVRTHIAQLDAHYDVHVQFMMGMTN